MERLISFIGLFVMIGLAWSMSSNKRLFPWRVVIGGLILQFVFAGILFASRDKASGGKPAPAGSDAAMRAEVEAAGAEDVEKPADIEVAEPADPVADEAEHKGVELKEAEAPRKGL